MIASIEPTTPSAAPADWQRDTLTEPRVSAPHPTFRSGQAYLPCPTHRSHGRLASDRRSLRVRLLTDPLWRRRCLKTHPGPRRPLSAPILARFLSRWNCHAEPG